MIAKHDLILVYLAFPVLEAILKKTCAQFVDYDGRVVSSFDVTRSDGGVHSYRSGGRCGSIRDLLFLLHQRVASAELVRALDYLRRHLQSLDARDPFDLLYDWRNASLHGQTSFPTIGGTVLNTALLIALDSVKDDYERIRGETRERVDRDVEGARVAGLQSPWSFYPPYLSRTHAQEPRPSP